MTTEAEWRKILKQPAFLGCGGCVVLKMLEAEKAFELIKAKPDAVNTELLEALEKFLDMYTRLVDSGDTGTWDMELEDEVIAARAAIKRATN